MSRTFAEAMAEVHHRANIQRKKIASEQWEGEAAPGGVGFIVPEKPTPSADLEKEISEVHAQRNQQVKDMTKENWDETIPVTDIAAVDHINKVEEAKKAMTVNKSSNLLDQWKKNNIPQSGALNSPIPTMKEPPLVKEDEIAEGEAWDATKAAAGSALRFDRAGLAKAAGDWLSATKKNVTTGADKLADYIHPEGAVKTTKNPAGPEDPTAPVKAAAPTPATSAPPPSMASAPPPAPSAAPSTKNVASRDKAPGGGAPAVRPAPKPMGGYKINRGDTLSSISRKTGLSIQQIAKQNNIKDVNKIRAGASLNLSGAKPNTAGAVAKDRPAPTPPRRPEVIEPAKKMVTAPLPPRKPNSGPTLPAPNVAPSGGTGVQGGNPTVNGGSIIDRQRRNTAPSQNRPAPAPVRGGSVPPQTSTSSTAMSRPQDTRGQQKFLRRETLSNSYENPLINSFLALQETEGNMFAEAKKKTNSQAKKYSEGDKDEIRDDPDQGAVASSTGSSAIAESIQRAARVSMFDPAQGYSRTAGSADGAAGLKERIAAAWNSLSSGYPATHPETDQVTDAVAADMAALREETEINELYGKGKLDTILRGIESKQDALQKKASRANYLMAASQRKDSHKGPDSEKKHFMSKAKELRREETEVLDEAPKKKESLADLAAAAIAKGHKITKLPPGKAEGWADNNVKSSFGGGVSKINSQSGTKTKARFREEVEIEEEQLDELNKKTLKSYVGKVEKRGETGKRADGLERAQRGIAKQTSTRTLDAKVKKLGSEPIANHKHDFEYDSSREELKRRGITHFAGKRWRNEEVEVDEEHIEEGKANGHKMTDQDKHLKGYYNVFGRHPIQKNDKLASKVWNKPAADMRTTKSGKIHGQDQKAKANEIRGRLGSHTKAKLPEGVEFTEEELNHIYGIMENNPEGNAIAGRDPNAKQGDSDKSTVGGIANESKKNGIRR